VVAEAIAVISRTPGGHLGLAAILNFSKKGHNSIREWADRAETWYKGEWGSLNPLAILLRIPAAIL